MNGKYRLWIVLPLLAAFAAGVVGGIFLERSFLHPRHHTRVQRGPSHPPNLEEMARELGLSLDQKEAIQRIFESNDSKFKGLYAEMHERLSALRSEIKTQIDAVLTPEQKKKMEALIAKHSEEGRTQSPREGDKNERDSSPNKPEGERQ